MVALLCFPVYYLTRMIFIRKTLCMWFSVFRVASSSGMCDVYRIYGNVSLQTYGGPGTLSHVFKIWSITFQGSGPSGPILFICEKSLIKCSSYSKSTNFIKQKVHVGCQYNNTCLKQPLKKGQNKDLLTCIKR